MRVLVVLLTLLALVGTTACQQQPKPDAAALQWLDDVELQIAAAKQRESQAVVSAEELNLAAEPVRASVRTASASPQRASTPRRTASASRATTSRPASSAPRAEPRVVTVKNTKRDAAIGAGAGAVIGATVAGRGNRVKGAVIGAAVGGVAGAVIGSTVDVQRRVEN